MDVAEVVAPAATDLLVLSTAGSVDDGKSTLIGRLLHDARAILEDQLEHVEATSRARGDHRLDLALVTDGLRAEREQGITIDVAYRSFTTPRRRFVIADTPGHVQYTRNMVTGASTADLAVVLVDARVGLTEQSRRHLSIAALLHIPHMVVAVNKMDLVGWSQPRFAEVRDEFAQLARELAIDEVVYVPVSALHGDNVVEPSANLAWYGGPTLLRHLEDVPVVDDRAGGPARLPVQWVIRPHTDRRPDYRAFAGQLASGRLAVGDPVIALPSGHATTVTAIDVGGEPIPEAAAPLSVAVQLADHLDVCRGTMLAAAKVPPPIVGHDLSALVCWMGDAQLAERTTYALKHTTRTVRARVEEITSALDLASGRHDPAVASLGPNDIGRIRLRSAAPIVYDPYATDRVTGSFVLIDEVTDATVVAGMLLPPA